MKTKTLFKDLSGCENLPVALWLIKDACWLMNFHLAAMIMIVPALAVAIHFAWRSRKNNTGLFRNVAITYWIAANGIWMTGEFFGNDSLRPYAMVLFVAGLTVVAAYYAFHFPATRKKAVSQPHTAISRTMMEEIQKVA